MTLDEDEHEDPELEAFLRRFQPRRPPPLRARTGARRSARATVIWTAAAAVAVAVGAMLPGRDPPRPGTAAVQPPRPTVGALSAALRAGAYEAALDEIDAHLLPDPARPGGALAVLADVRADWR